MPIVLTLTGTRVSAVPPIAGWTLAEYTDGNISNSKNRIGEYKRVKLSFTSSANIFNYKFYLDPGLFVNKSSPITISGAGTRYYYMQPVVLGLTTASYNALGATFPNIDKVINVFMIATTTTAFDIYIDFYQAYDYEGFLEPNVGDNPSHLLKDKKSSTSLLTVSGSSVYNDTNVDLRNYLYVEHVSIPTDNATYDINSMYGYKAGFYNQGTHGAAAYWLNPVFTFSTGTNVISGVADTFVGFRVTPPGGLSVDFFVATIIRTDTTDNSVDFATNYELEQVWVDPTSTPTSKLKNFVASYVGTGPTFNCNFDIDYTGLVLGATYRLIIHAYNNNFPTSYEIDAFISDELTVTADMPYTGNGFDVTARLRDLKHSYTGNYLTCCIEERIRSTIVLDYMDDYGINMYFRDIFNRLGLTITDVSRYLSQVSFTIYDISSTPGQKHVVDSRTVYKTSPFVYASRGGGITVTFNAGDITLEADWRNRYESGTLNVETYDTVTGAALGPLSNQYWGGRSFVIEWGLTYYYDDYITPFTDEIVIQQQIIVRDYSSCVQIYAQNSPDENNEFWCPEDTMCLRSEFDLACSGGEPAANYELITTIEPDPGSITTIQEHEAFVPLILPQQTSALITSQEVTYSTTLLNNAKFCVDVANLLLTDYKITAIAKRT